MSDKDIIEFLSSGRFKSAVLKSLRGGRKIHPFFMMRILSLYGLRKGYFSLSETIRLILPGRFRSSSLQYKYWQFLDAEAKSELAPFLTSDGNAIMLYGRPFHFPPIEIMHCGYYYLASTIFQVIVFDQYRLADHLKDSDVSVIDAGANIGVFSVFAAYTYPHIRIYAFEPQPDMFTYLKENAKEWRSVTCYNLGLGDRAAKKTMYGHTFEDSGYGQYEKKDGKEASITTVDEFARANKVPRITLIKIDTEGYEAPILKGARETIARERPVITMSAYHHKDDKTTLPTLVRSIDDNYSCELREDDEADLICSPISESIRK